MPGKNALHDFTRETIFNPHLERFFRKGEVVRR
jgi:hypothetical protein